MNAQDKQLEDASEKYVITERKLIKSLAYFLEDIEKGEVVRKGNSREHTVREWLYGKDLLQSFQLEHKQAGAGVWVKASERLPALDWKGVMDIDGLYHNSDGAKIKWYFQTYPNCIIQWLDETHPQQPISIEAISAMAEKKYPCQEDLKYVEHKTKIGVLALLQQNAFIKDFTSALQYSAGDNWISVDEPPKESGRYWCYVEEINDLGKSHYQWNCAYSANENRWSDGTALTPCVTHWQKLPKPPIKKQ